MLLTGHRCDCLLLMTMSAHLRFLAHLWRQTVLQQLLFDRFRYR